MMINNVLYNKHFKTSIPIIVLFFVLCGCVENNKESNEVRLFHISEYFGGTGNRVIATKVPCEVLLTGYKGSKHAFTDYKGSIYTLLKFNMEQGEMTSIIPDDPFVYDFNYCNEKDVFITCIGDPKDKSTLNILLKHYSDMKEISIIHPEGQCFTPSISPVENAVVFSCEEKDTIDGANLFLVRYSTDNNENQELTRLTSGKTFDAFPLWMPEEQQIVFFRSTRFYRSSPIASKRWHLWKPYILDIKTMEIKLLYDDHVYNLSWPTFSKNGKWLAYGEKYYGFLLINMDRDLHQNKTLYIKGNNSDADIDNSYTACYPVFTSDSKKLIYFIKKIDTNVNSENIICIMDLNTMTVTLSEPLPLPISNLVVSNDDNYIYIIFRNPSKRINSLYQIWKMSISDFTLKFLWENTGTDYF